MESLRPIAESVVDRHIRKLEKERLDKRLYRPVNIDGQMYGRAIVKDGPKYKKYRDQGIPMRLLRAEEKQYACRSLFRRSLQGIFTPDCHDCQKKFCAYCKFRAAGHVLERGNDPLLAFASLMTRPLGVWGTFREENNFARTKTIIGLLRSEPKFMVAFARLLLAHTVVVVPGDIDDDDENVYHPPWIHNIIFCLVLMIVVFIFVSYTS